MGIKDESTPEFNDLSAEKKQQYETEFITWFRTLSAADKRELERNFNDISAEKEQQYETEFITWFRTLSAADKRELERIFNELSAAEKQQYETGFNNLSAAEKRKLKDESLTSLKEYQKVSCCMRDPCTIDIYVSLHIYPPRCAFSLHPALRILASVRT